MINEIFKENNLKVTKQRIDIVNIIEKLGDGATVKNIIKNTNMNKSTVYRILDKLCLNNIIIKDININNEDYYSLKSNHKHYIKCVKCNKIKDLDNCPVEDINIKDFKVIKHTLKIDGICDECMN